MRPTRWTMIADLDGNDDHRGRERRGPRVHRRARCSSSPRRRRAELTRPPRSRTARPGRPPGVHGARALHRGVRDGRRADAPGPDRERPGERVDARLQGRPRHAESVRRPAAEQHGDRPGGRRASRRASRPTGWSPTSARSRVRDTGEPLDLAIVGDGWFGVQTAQGTRYTRNGQFTAAADGTLTDQLGNPVLGRNGQPVKVDASGHVDAPGRRRLRARPTPPSRATTSSAAPPRGTATRHRPQPARSRARASTRPARWST